jgi:helicase
MPEVIRINDSDVLLPTTDYEYANWKFDKFNPVQSAIVRDKLYETNNNIAIAAATSCGKTLMAEMFMSCDIRKNGGKALYVGPLKALAKEKEQDWCSDDHHFKNLNISICTGDYRLTQKRVKEMDEADVIIMTPEMLASRARNEESEKSNFLRSVKCLVFDESHLLTVPNRGDHIEVALMKIVEINPDVRIVLLSATMPNVDEICKWICHLTGRDTYYLESSFRPCPLNIHYECYYDGDRQYDDVEAQKVGTALGIIEYFHEDKFLVFVHTKRTGKLMLEHLKRHKIDAEFHSADLALAARLKLEKKFKEDADFRVVVSTSTLAWGCNLPARRVIITGVYRGLSPVENYDIQQMIGRAGRPAYDPKGDAYILIPETTQKETIAKLRKKSKIESQLLTYVGTEDKPHYKVLAFHLVSEIYSKSITTKEGFHTWFRKSLANYQNQGFNDKLIDTVIDQLAACFAITKEDDEYKATNIGKVASIFYFSPFDVSDLRRNFKQIFDHHQESDDHAVAMALGNIDSFRWGITSRDERDQMGTFSSLIKRKFGDQYYTDSVMKSGYAYYNMITGKYNVPAFAALQAGLRADSDRTLQVLKAIDSMSARWDKQEYFKVLQKRLTYGVTTNLLDLCQIPDVGKARAERLWAANIRSLDIFVNTDSSVLASVMKLSQKATEEALAEAKMIKVKKLVE